MSEKHLFGHPRSCLFVELVDSRQVAAVSVIVEAVSDNELIIADVNQIAGGKGSILVGYPQEFYGFSNNKGSCGNQSWENEENYDSAKVDELLPKDQV